MSDITAPRYGYDPKVAFAATRAGAERRARESAPPWRRTKDECDRLSA